MGKEDKKGTLYLCGTPIGNREDITLRALRILKEVNLIAAEDTRKTRRLLNYYQIKTHLTSYHDYNQKKKGEQLLSLLKEGKDIALVSNSGMPVISDPGYDLVRLAIKEEIALVPIPGPTALITALIVSGLPSSPFIFSGFLPRKKVKRIKYLKELKENKETIIFFESPHRLLSTLEDILNTIGDRRITVGRELTKKFEEISRGKVSQVLKKFKENKPQGEFTLVLEGNAAQNPNVKPQINTNHPNK